jgi:hypothetical protein
MIKHSASGYAPYLGDLEQSVITEKYNNMQSTVFGKISFWIALSPWFFILPGWMGVPGFG